MEEADYARKVLRGDILEIRHLGQDVAWRCRGYCGWEVDRNGCWSLLVVACGTDGIKITSFVAYSVMLIALNQFMIGYVSEILCVLYFPF